MQDPADFCGKNAGCFRRRSLPEVYRCFGPTKVRGERKDSITSERTLVTQIPDVEAFLALAPEELAVKMLFLLRQYIAL
jgi:hypothetical protein